MTKNIILLFTILLTSFPASAAKPETVSEDLNVINSSTVTVTNEPRFVGFSNEAVYANTGLAGMHDACASTYGAGARMCLDIEVFKTPGLKSVPSVTKGWLQPTNQLSAENPGSLSCNGWSVNTGSSATWLTGDMQIKFGSNGCENLFRVACCK